LACEELSHRILIVEDDLVLRETLAYRLSEQGYEVLLAESGPEGLHLARQERPDVILLDVILPGLDGFEVCRQIRQELTMPILMLTARSDEVDRVVGLEIGADDYITKPFSMRELLARIKASIRRACWSRESPADALPLAASETLCFGNLEIDLSRCEVKLDGERLLLKPREYELLITLAQNQGQVLTRDQLMGSVWDYECSEQSRTIYVHIRWLREKIEENPSAPHRIVTVRGLGYRFEG
jgi:DNA-binding response OmpR family regulator